MSGRESEAVMLDRCRGVATRGAEGASDQREANVFRLAAMLVRARHPLSSAGLMAASERYFLAHPDERLAAEDVLRRGWVTSLPRLRDLLDAQLREEA